MTTTHTAKQMVDIIMHDPSASFWLKDALSSALKRDSLDASRDAHLLHSVLLKVWSENAAVGKAK